MAAASPPAPHEACLAADEAALAEVTRLKAEGNTHYSDRHFEQALSAYSLALAAVPERWLASKGSPPAVLSAAGLCLRQQAAVVLANRAAANMGLRKAVAALADAQRAADLDPAYWKAHWRCGLALMMMGVRIERSEQAIAAFKRALSCDGLPPAERENVCKALEAAEHRLREGRDALDMPDLSECVVS